MLGLPPGTTLARAFALGMGLAFLMAAVGGFLPVMTHHPAPTAPPLAVAMSHGLLLGLFPVNVVHNLAHLLFGIAGGLAGAAGAAWSRRYCRWLAVALTIFTVLGAVPAWSTVGGLLPLHGHDVWLHGLEAAAAAWCGWRDRRLA